MSNGGIFDCDTNSVEIFVHSPLRSPTHSPHESHWHWERTGRVSPGRAHHQSSVGRRYHNTACRGCTSLQTSFGNRNSTSIRWAFHFRNLRIRAPRVDAGELTCDGHGEPTTCPYSSLGMRLRRRASDLPQSNVSMSFVSGSTGWFGVEILFGRRVYFRRHRRWPCVVYLPRMPVAPTPTSSIRGTEVDRREMRGKRANIPYPQNSGVPCESWKRSYAWGET